MEIRKLPVGVQSFEKIRTENYLYIDKTEYLWKMLQMGGVYFLSRPRRFGKSLFLSTAEAYFQGKKELFDGLYIGTQEKEWNAYPVIRFSLAGGSYSIQNGLSDKLSVVLLEVERQYNLTGDYRVIGDTLPARFGSLLKQLYHKTGKQAVVLVDEYDKPLLETIEVNPEQEEKNRALYKGFFSVLKDEDRYLKFVLFTGVTKFGKVSIFSDLNQLEDISLTDDYACICGITEQEMRDNLKPEIEALSRKFGTDDEECVHQLGKMYDGYHFSAAGEGVYNPFSLLNALKQKNMDYYWYETGTPTFLIHKLQNSSFNAEQLTDGVEATRSEIRDYTPENTNPIPLFYQSGYLTISGYDPEFQLYTLKFPNEEVRHGFLNSLAPVVLGEKDADRPVSAKAMIQDLRKGEAESFLSRLQALFAGIPYVEGKTKDYEHEWRNEIYLIFALLGQNIHCEVHSARGRADCLIETKDYVYLFEFKVDASAEEALEQIKKNGYAEPFAMDVRKVYRIGVNFSSEKRNIEKYLIR